MKAFTPYELLDAREKRVGLIDALIKRYNTPLLVMRVNYPGLKKINDLTLAIIDDMIPLICKVLSPKVRGKHLTQGAEGPIFFVAVEEDVHALKAIAINFEENHRLGRCLDLDVYDNRGTDTGMCISGNTNMDTSFDTRRLGKSISRQELGYPRRTCYLCEDFAHYCVRARRHSEHEVINYIEEQYRDYTNPENRYPT